PGRRAGGDTEKAAGSDGESGETVETPFLAGARVTVIDGEGGFIGITKRRPGTEGGERHAAGTTTDEEGRYAIDHLRPGRYYVVASDGEHAEAVRSLHVREGDSKKVDLALDKGRSIKGTVVDPEKKPLAGILVSMVYPERQATTDAEGRFELGGIGRRQGGAELVATDPSGRMGYQKASSGGGRRRGGRGDIEIVMHPAARIEGTLVQAGGEGPIDGTVELHSLGAQGGGFFGAMFGGGGSSTPNQFDAPGGRFAIDGLPQGRYRLYGSAPGMATGYADAQVAPGQTETVEITIGVGGTIVGRVVDLNGAPIPGAVVAEIADSALTGSMPPERMLELQLAAVDDVAPETLNQGARFPWLPGAVFTSTDASGGFRIADVPAGRRRLICAHENFVVENRALDVPDGQEAQIELRLSSGGGITGTVFDETGAPLAGASLVASIPMMTGRTIDTDDQGQYEVRGLPDGNYMVMLMTSRKIEDNGGDQGRPEMKTVLVTEGEMITANFGELVETATVVGTVVMERGATPRRVTMAIRGQGFGGMRREDLGADATFQFDEVKPGTYDFVIEGFRQELVVQGDEGTITVDLVVPNLSVRGIVRDSLGSPIEGADVTAVRLTDTPPNMFATFMRPDTRTDATGAFELSGLIGTDYTIKGDKDGYTAKTLELTVSGGVDPGVIEIVLTLGGAIHGEVLGPDGQEIGGAMLVAEDARGKTYGTGSESFGHAFRGGNPKLEGLPPGTYTVWALSTAYAFDRVEGIEVTDEPVEVSMNLSPGGDIKVTCLEGEDQPVAGCTVDLVIEGSAVPTTLFESFFTPSESNTNGVYRRDRLMAGSYLGVLTAPDGRRATFQTEILDEETAEVTVTLPLPPAAEDGEAGDE
ncbi:MAG: carboxypeptidase regulatory-like domain-containing protein, partial [Planctomycetota bacterium]